jgi:hypothetical protein
MWRIVFIGSANLAVPATFADHASYGRHNIPLLYRSHIRNVDEPQPKGFKKIPNG